MGFFLLAIIVITVIGLMVWQYRETQVALATTTVRSPHDPARTVEIVNSAFGGARAALWTEGSGPGVVNRRRRGKDRGITMSIDVEHLDDGGSRVDMWASETNVYLGIWVNFAGSVNGRKKAIAKRLAEPAETRGPA